MFSDYEKTYVKFLLGFLNIKKPLKVVFDCSNGTTGNILKHLKTGKLKAILINQNPDGNFPAHSPDPLTKGVTGQLKKEVLKNKADFGVIFDADGDRARFVDDKGRDVDSDIIARILIWEFKPKAAAADILTGWAVKNLKTENTGVKIIFGKVGHQFIVQNMKRNKADLGIEYSGHYYFRLNDSGNYFYMDSGILSAIKVINAVSEMPLSLSQFADLIAFSFRETLAVSQKQSGVVNKKFKKIKNFYGKSAVKISGIDGLSMEFEDFWFNIRFSNTEPLIRLNIEAINKRTLDKQKKMLLNLLDAR